MAAKAQQRYRVMERLASGGMAEVFVAESAGLEGFKKKVAIKRVLPHLSEKKSFIAMFLDEARLSAQFSHSNVVHVFDIGVGDSAFFIVMEYVEGCDLKTVMRSYVESNQRFPVEAAIYIASKICEGLAYAHELEGLDGEPLHAVHRDISPPNVLLSKHGEIKIVDFGLAKASSQLEKSEPGIIKGKFSYLSPEAAFGNDVDARTDIFAVGVILWEMLAGEKLFQGRNDLETVQLIQVASVPPIATRNPDAGRPELQRILSKALARERADRYSSARELGRDLTRLLFRIGKPVDAFTVAKFVRQVSSARDGAVPVQGMQYIDKLIDETLLRFTSLRDRTQSQVSDVAEIAGPRSLQLDELDSFRDVDPRAESNDAARLLRANLPARALEGGNLAALEDTPSELNVASMPSSASPRRRGVDPELLGEDAEDDATVRIPWPLESGAAAVPLLVPAAAKPNESAPKPNESAPKLKEDAAKPTDEVADDEPGVSAGARAIQVALLLLIAAGAGVAIYLGSVL